MAFSRQRYGSSDSNEAENLPEEFLTERKLMQVSQRIGNDQKLLGVCLHMEDSKIQQIKADNKDVTVDQTFKILLHWKQGNDKRESEKVKHLAGALKEIGRKDLSDMLTKEFKEYKSKIQQTHQASSPERQTYGAMAKNSENPEDKKRLEQKAKPEGKRNQENQQLAEEAESSSSQGSAVDRQTEVALNDHSESDIMCGGKTTSRNKMNPSHPEGSNTYNINISNCVISKNIEKVNISQQKHTTVDNTPELSMASVLTKLTPFDWNATLKSPPDRTKEEQKTVVDISNYLQHFSLDIDFKETVKTHKKLMEHSAYVCYIEHSYGSATGFVLGTTCHTVSRKTYVTVMTACHVLRGEPHREIKGLKDSWDNGNSGFVAFNFEAKNEGYTNLPILKDVVMEDKDLDFAVLVLDPDFEPEKHIPSKEGLGKTVALQYTLSDREALRLIGHPGAEKKILDHLFVVKDAISEAKIITKRNGYFEYKEQTEEPCEDRYKMYYHCRSFKGASGSPYFQGDRLIGMHSGGMWLPFIDDQRITDIEYGVPMHAILTRMLEKIKSSEKPTLNEEGFYTLFPHYPK